MEDDVLMSEEQLLKALREEAITEWGALKTEDARLSLSTKIALCAVVLHTAMVARRAIVTALSALMYFVCMAGMEIESQVPGCGMQARGMELVRSYGIDPANPGPLPAAIPRATTLYIGNRFKDGDPHKPLNFIKLDNDYEHLEDNTVSLIKADPDAAHRMAVTANNGASPPIEMYDMPKLADTLMGVLSDLPPDKQREGMLDPQNIKALRDGMTGPLLATLNKNMGLDATTGAAEAHKGLTLLFGALFQYDLGYLLARINNWLTILAAQSPQMLAELKSMGHGVELGSLFTGDIAANKDSNPAAAVVDYLIMLLMLYATLFDMYAMRGAMPSLGMTRLYKLIRNCLVSAIAMYDSRKAVEVHNTLEARVQSATIDNIQTQLGALMAGSAEQRALAVRLVQELAPQKTLLEQLKSAQGVQAFQFDTMERTLEGMVHSMSGFQDTLQGLRGDVASLRANQVAGQQRTEGELQQLRMQMDQVIAMLQHGGPAAGGHGAHIMATMKSNISSLMGRR